VFVLKPYHNNALKCLIKTPKVYFLDTGLASYLVGWDNAQVLQNGAMSGAFFETFVIGEIIKSWANKEGVTPNMNFFFFRDKEGNEIGLLIKRGEGCVVCMADDVLPITPTDKAVGVRYL